MNWRDKTCETCLYMKNRYCRLSPPIVFDNNPEFDRYPGVNFRIVRGDKNPYEGKYIFMDACSKYKEIA